jgi:hypothetical protein
MTRREGPRRIEMGVQLEEVDAGQLVLEDVQYEEIETAQLERRCGSGWIDRGGGALEVVGAVISRGGVERMQLVRRV